MVSSKSKLIVLDFFSINLFHCWPVQDFPGLPKVDTSKQVGKFLKLKSRNKMHKKKRKERKKSFQLSLNSAQGSHMEEFLDKNSSQSSNLLNHKVNPHNSNLSSFDINDLFPIPFKD